MSVSSGVLSNWERLKGKSEVCFAACSCVITVWLMGRIELSGMRFTKTGVSYSLFTQSKLTCPDFNICLKSCYLFPTASHCITMGRMSTLYSFGVSEHHKKLYRKIFKPTGLCLRGHRKTIDGDIFERSLRGFQGLNPLFLSGWRLVGEPVPVDIWRKQTWLWSSLCAVQAVGQKGS